MNRIGNDQVFIEFDGNYQNSNFIPLRLCIEGEYLIRANLRLKLLKYIIIIA